jgi:predicted phosphohydrolase
MKVRYFSDLHLEFIKPNKIDQFIKKIPSGLNEICILAGDIGNSYQKNFDIFMNFISNNFKKTFYITGNHEYYNKTKTIQETNDFLHDYFKQFNNISFLNNKYEIYDNYCFIGTTLWSKITNPLYEINDIDCIPYFNYLEYNKLNKICIEFLKETIQNNENCIVITHHVPSFSLIDVKYKNLKMMPYNQWFYCNLDEVIETYQMKIKYWIYGHTHTSSNVLEKGIEFCCNPIGYPNENSILDFQKSFTINSFSYLKCPL